VALELEAVRVGVGSKGEEVVLPAVHDEGEPDPGSHEW